MRSISSFIAKLNLKTDKKTKKRWNQINELSYLWDIIPPVLHLREVYSVITIVNIVRGHPLDGILSALCRNASDLHCPSEVDL